MTYAADIAVPKGTPACPACQVLFLYYEDGREISIGQVPVGADWKAVAPPIAFTQDRPVSAFLANDGFAQSSQSLVQQVMPFSISARPAQIPFDTAFDLVATSSLSSGQIAVNDQHGSAVCTITLGAAQPGCENIMRPTSTAGTEQWTASYGGATATFPVSFVEQLPAGVTLSASTSAPNVGTPFSVDATSSRRAAPALSAQAVHSCSWTASRAACPFRSTIRVGRTSRP